MATHTNNLTSHNGEHRTYPADKAVPIAVLRGPSKYARERLEAVFGDKAVRQASPSPVNRKGIKKEHTRRSRAFHKQEAREAMYAPLPREQSLSIDRDAHVIPAKPTHLSLAHKPEAMFFGQRGDVFPTADREGNHLILANFPDYDRADDLALDQPILLNAEVIEYENGAFRQGAVVVVFNASEAIAQGVRQNADFAFLSNASINWLESTHPVAKAKHKAMIEHEELPTREEHREARARYTAASQKLQLAAEMGAVDREELRVAEREAHYEVALLSSRYGHAQAKALPRFISEPSSVPQVESTQPVTTIWRAENRARIEAVGPLVPFQTKCSLLDERREERELQFVGRIDGLLAVWREPSTGVIATGENGWCDNMDIFVSTLDDFYYEQGREFARGVEETVAREQATPVDSPYVLSSEPTVSAAEEQTPPSL